MKVPLPFIFAGVLASTAPAQTLPSPGEVADATAAPPATDNASSSAPAPSARHIDQDPADASAEAMDHLTRANQELLDLLKKQQAVLEDIQYDRRLQNRQISLIEQRLEDTLQLNASLQAKVAQLQAAAAAKNELSAPPPVQDIAPKTDASATPPEPPPPPASFLPPAQTGGDAGTLWWHRLVSLSGENSKNSDTFHIMGKQWRVLWHNQDKPGDTYKNTSALFISAFPRNDTLPKKVCSQLGTGDNVTELTGSGDFYLKIEASGGNWELAVEDFR